MNAEIIPFNIMNQLLIVRKALMHNNSKIYKTYLPKDQNKIFCTGKGAAIKHRCVTHLYFLFFIQQGVAGLQKRAFLFFK